MYARRFGPVVAFGLTLAAVAPVHAQPAGPFSFYPVEPCRLLDTRTPAGGPALTTNTPEPPPPAPPTASSVVRALQVRGACEIRADAEALVYNLTVVGQPYTGHLTLYPSNVPVPTTSNLNFSPNTTLANGGVVRLNTAAVQDLKVRLFLAAPLNTQVHIVIDVTGYFAP